VAKLAPGEEVMCEPGGMLTREGKVQPSVQYGSCGLGCQRCCCAGENCCRVHWKNNDSKPLPITITPFFPAKVIPLNLDKHSGINVKMRAWMASFGNKTEHGVKMAPSFGTACCAGQGCFITTLNGSGTTFLSLGGTVYSKVLAPGEKMIVDQRALVAWDQTVTMEVKTAGNCCTMCCGGMGLFNVALTGPGMVMIQSMAYENAAKGYLAAKMGQKGGGMEAPVS